MSVDDHCLLPLISADQFKTEELSIPFDILIDDFSNGRDRIARPHGIKKVVLSRSVNGVARDGFFEFLKYVLKMRIISDHHWRSYSSWEPRFLSRFIVRVNRISFLNQSAEAIDLLFCNFMDISG